MEESLVFVNGGLKVVGYCVWVCELIVLLEVRKDSSAFFFLLGAQKREETQREMMMVFIPSAF